MSCNIPEHKSEKKNDARSTETGAKCLMPQHLYMSRTLSDLSLIPPTLWMEKSVSHVLDNYFHFQHKHGETTGWKSILCNVIYAVFQRKILQSHASPGQQTQNWIPGFIAWLCEKMSTETITMFEKRTNKWMRLGQLQQNLINTSTFSWIGYPSSVK